MEKLMAKLEKIIEGYLDNLENKPLRTLAISIFVYIIFKHIGRK
jgi:hypothetical protein